MACGAIVSGLGSYCWSVGSRSLEPRCPRCQEVLCSGCDENTHHVDTEPVPGSWTIQHQLAVRSNRHGSTS